MHSLTPAGALVGRHSEMALLTGLIKDVARGRGGSVLIEGEPGIGKSALVRAAVAEAPEAGCQVFWGAGDELGQALPLLPFLDALRVREPATNPRRNAIVRLLRGEVSTDRGTDVPAVLAEQLLALVAEECAVRPTILVVDDLQWADPASITLWGRLAGSARRVPLLLVGMMRPVPQREDVLALRRVAGDAGRHQLAGLTAAAVADLVAALAGGRPDDNLLRLADGAAGNPFYVTELVAALARGSGLTITEAGAAVLAGGSVPGSLSAAIADRLGFAAGQVRQILQAAALLGVDFAVHDLAIVLDRSVADLIPAVEEARAAGVLVESGADLGFRHPLIRAALYDEMPASVRSAWHRDAGRALAEAGAPADRVARQMLRAVGGPDGTTEPVDEWMLDWLARTADLLVGQAPGVAAELLSRAVSSSPAASARHGWLASRLADALYRTGEGAAAEQVANRALEHAAEPDLLVDLHWTLAQCRLRAGETAESLATLDRALASPGVSARHRARLLVLAARTRLSIGEVEKVGPVATDALEAASAARDSWAMGWALHVLTLVTAVQGHAIDALPLFDRALAVTQSDPALTDLRLLLQLNKAVNLGNLDRYDEALALAGQARDLADQVGTAIRLAQAHCVLGQLLFETGRWDDALAEVEIVHEDQKAPDVACCDLGIAAVISFHRGETGAAHRYLAAADPHARRIGHRFVASLALARSLDREHDGALAELMRLRMCSRMPSASPPRPATQPPPSPLRATPTRWPPARRSRTGRPTCCTAAACWTAMPPGYWRPRNGTTTPAGRCRRRRRWKLPPGTSSTPTTATRRGRRLPGLSRSIPPWAPPRTWPDSKRCSASTASGAGRAPNTGGPKAAGTASRRPRSRSPRSSRRGCRTRRSPPGCCYPGGRSRPTSPTS
jgi:tetratricopeptide (TPR) repeat protein